MNRWIAALAHLVRVRLALARRRQQLREQQAYCLRVLAELDGARDGARVLEAEVKALAEAETLAKQNFRFPKPRGVTA